MKDWTDRYHRVAAPPGFDGNTKRKAYYLPSKARADALHARIAKYKADRKVPGFQAVEITDQDRNWLGYLRNRLGDLGKLPAVIDHWERTSAAVINKTTVRDMSAQFVEFKAGESDSRRTLNDIKYRLRQFVNRYGDAYVHEVTTPQVREFLQSVPKGDSRRNSYKWLSPAFEFAKERHMVSANPFAVIDRPPAGRAEPGIYTPDAIAGLLNAADARFSELLPFLACAGLAGMRTAELLPTFVGDEVLQWSDVLWEKRLLHVRPEVAKQTRRKSGDRRYPPIEPALAHWTEPHRKDAGPIVSCSKYYFLKRMRALFIQSEVLPVRNGLRHSFASYWLARTGQEGVGRLAVILGCSEAVAKRHYVSTLEPGDGDAWFGIRRASA
jgi:integrase